MPGPTTEHGGLQVSSLAIMLQRFEELLHQQQAPLAQLLRPPATQPQLAALEAALDAPLPADAKSWWLWHNGTSGGTWMERSFVAAGEFLSTDEALALWQQRCRSEIAYRERGWPEMWKESWVPLTHAAHNADLVLDPSGTVYVYDPADPESGTPRARSLASVVELWVQLMESGRLQWNEIGEWQVGKVPVEIPAVIARRAVL